MASSSYVRVPIGLTVALGVAIMMACSSGDDDGGTDNNQFRGDVLDCENALSYLQQCCGKSFDPTAVECHHLFEKDEGCGDSKVTKQDPDLNEDESDCILDQSCDAIRKNNVCPRVTNRGVAIATGAAYLTDGGAAILKASVCP